MDKRATNRDFLFKPCYLAHHQNGEIARRAQKLWSRMEQCDLCPRQCHADRLSSKRGYCGASDLLEISSWSPHFGEEQPLVGTHGSGTIFFTHCSLKCIYCQNWEISHCGKGTVISIEHLAQIMIRLQEMGCHNINLVTPDHYITHILKSLDIAITNGLRIPLVYNTGGWVSTDILSLLDGIIDIYMPDFKYWTPQNSSLYSCKASTYPSITRKAILEMHRQVGVATVSSSGILNRGLIIRHLVLPNNVAGSKQVINWIAQNLPHNTYLNLMSQYHPSYRAKEHKEISRSIFRHEYIEVLRWARKAGLTQTDSQSIPL